MFATSHRYYWTDIGEKFPEVGENFYGIENFLIKKILG